MGEWGMGEWETISLPHSPTLPFPHSPELESVPDTKMRAAPFAPEAVVQPDRPDRRLDPDADPHGREELEAAVLFEIRPQPRVREAEAAASPPGAARVREQHSDDPVQQRAPVLDARHHHM